MPIHLEVRRQLRVEDVVCRALVAVREPALIIARAGEGRRSVADPVRLAHHLDGADVHELAVAAVRLPDDLAEAFLIRDLDVLEVRRLDGRRVVTVAEDHVVDAVRDRARVLDRDAVRSAVERGFSGPPPEPPPTNVPPLPALVPPAPPVAPPAPAPAFPALPPELLALPALPPVLLALPALPPALLVPASRARAALIRRGLVGAATTRNQNHPDEGKDGRTHECLLSDRVRARARVRSKSRLIPLSEKSSPESDGPGRSESLSRARPRISLRPLSAAGIPTFRT